MNSDLNAAIAVSAPGKVLLAGGYLVLDREYTGLVFGLDARIHAHIARTSTTAGVSLERIVVRSPQFREAVWEYGYRVTEASGGVELTQLTVSAQDKIKRNPFVETTLSYVLTYIVSLSSPVISPASVTILADDSYYTQPALSEPASSVEETKTETKEKTFSDFGVRLSDAHKTGLGSSAALVTSLTAALLVHYLPKDVFSLDREVDRRKLHNIAQIAHCAAQGKVGSGFDVASAVYGSCLYRRFSPSLFEGLGIPSTAGFATRLQALVEESSDPTRWDTEIIKSKVEMPSGIRMVMCDVDCGSETPGMVRQVLAWRKTEPEEADMLWTALHRKNEGLAATLTQLAQSAPSASPIDWTPLKTNLAEIRHFIRQMSRLSGVPIEPPPQTQLLDACSTLEGVIGGVVPGAGGYDAIVLLVEDKPDVLERLDKYLDAWKVETFTAEGEGGNAPSIGRVSRLPVREEMEGVREENVTLYSGWFV